MLIKLSRSALLTEQNCEREFYYKYLFDGTGIEAEGNDVTPAIGVAVHKGLESILNGVTLEYAIANALAKFEQLKPRQLDWEFDFIGYTLPECRFLIECLVRIGAMRAIPEILSQWSVVEAVEKKHIVPIPETSLGWVSIADGELNKNGLTSALSWKTTERWIDRKLEVPLIDMQGVSEPWAISQATGKPCHSVVMCWFLTGETREERGLGRRVKDSPLVRPWFNGKDWQWRYQWEEEGKVRRVGKDYKRTAVWEYMSAEEWIEALTKLPVLDPLRFQYVGPLEYTRPPWNEEAFVRQLTGKAQQLEALSVTIDYAREHGILQEVVDENFAQSTRGCPWCPYYSCCWRGMIDPVGSGEFKRRVR